MRLLLSGLLALSACLQVVLSQGDDATVDGMQNALNIQREQMSRLANLMDSAKKPPGGPAKGSTVTFKNPAAKKFLVDGTKIPDVDFDAGPSWSGLMPISGAKNETRKLFFWFWPANNPSDTKDLTFWTNGKI
ncbi:hypothetical protein CVT25_011057 [Psilocybe cyanescens]|uniref:Uncharacterized protein n=1 Tax=Psilocybe cyanescens TaxID=93625 RepID=A0A409WFG4_PSICY|nr:hypothetical protein CVT25_011057 [Psilocybe cyanescens]